MIIGFLSIIAEMKIDMLWLNYAKGAFKYYVSTFGGGLSQNADTADALEGGGVVLAKMLPC